MRSEIKTSAEAVFFSMRGAAQHGQKEACAEGNSTSQLGAKRRSSKSENMARHGCDDAPIDNSDYELSPKTRRDCTQSSSLRRVVSTDHICQSLNTEARTSSLPSLITTEQAPMRQDETEMPVEHDSSSIFWPRPRAITLSKLGGCTTTMQCESESAATFGSTTLELSKNSESSHSRCTDYLGSAPVSEDDLIAESAAVVAAHAKAAANAAMRGSEHEDGSAASTWAARVAERAALVTAARRDAELRAARLRLAGDHTIPRLSQKAASPGDFGIQGPVKVSAPLSGNQTNLSMSASSARDVACAARRAAEAASQAAAKLTASAEEPEECRRQVLLRAIDNLSDVAQSSSHDFCDPSHDDSCATHGAASKKLRDDVHFAPGVETNHGTKRQRVSSDSLPFLELCDPVVQRPQPSSELYSELYGWVPANLGVTASPEELSRHLGLNGEPQQQSPDVDDKLLAEAHSEAQKLLLGDECSPSATLVSCSPTRFATEPAPGRMLQCRVSLTQHVQSNGIHVCEETKTSRPPEDARGYQVRLQGGRLSSKPISLATTAAGQQSLQNGLIPKPQMLSSRSAASTTNTSSETMDSRLEPAVTACSNRTEADRLAAGRDASRAAQTKTEVDSAEHSAAHASKHQTPPCPREVPSGSAHFMGLTYRKVVVG